MRRVRGFTLLEMVVAIGIFAVIAAISYASLTRFLDARAFVDARQERVRVLQNTMSLIERDVRFMVNRPVRDGYGDEEAALVSGGDVPLSDGEIVRLTTAEANPELGLAPRLKRVAWRLLDGELQRVTWAVLDRDVDSKEYVRVLLAGVAAVDIKYYVYGEDDALETEEAWINPEALPAGVEFVVTLDNGVQYRRVFAVAGNS